MTAQLPTIGDVTLPELYEDPYPTYRRMRREAPVAFLKPANICLVTRFDDIMAIERDHETFPALDLRSLQIRSMGHSMMRKDGEAHQRERSLIEPSFRPATVKNHWTPLFERVADELIEGLKPAGGADLFTDFASPMAARCLQEILGLRQADWRDLGRWSQILIDATGNYGNDQALWAACEAANQEMNLAIGQAVEDLRRKPDLSVISLMANADPAVEIAQIRANVKVIIGGGLNEPRDSICSAIYGLLSFPDQIAAVRESGAHWKNVFEETVRWIAPIGMYPRRVARDTELGGVLLPAETAIGLSVASACRDEAHFENGEAFDIFRPRRSHLAFGAGPHFCLGTWIARKMVGEIAVPRLVERLPNLRFDPEAPARLGGWVFRGPLAVPVLWDA